MAKFKPNPVATAVKKALKISDEDMAMMDVGDLIQYSFAGQLPPNQLAYLAAYAMLGRHSEAARAMGAKGSPHHVWLAKDKRYREAYGVAQAIASEKIVDEIKRRAIEGNKKKKFHQGEPIIDPETGEQYCEIEYSDTLIMFIAKGLMPEMFRERAQLEVKGQLEVGDVSSNAAREIASQNTEFLERAKLIMNKNKTVKELPSGQDTNTEEEAGNQEPNQDGDGIPQEGDGREEAEVDRGSGEVQTHEPEREPREDQAIQKDVSETGD